MTATSLRRVERDHDDFVEHLIVDGASLSRSESGERASAEWQADDDGPVADEPIRSGRSRQSFDRTMVRTLLSERQLASHGLHVLDHEAQRWLISVDADDLTRDRFSFSWFGDLVARVSELRNIAAEEELPFIESSAREALAFAKELNATSRPGAFLVGNGCVRLLWTDGPEQIGLQFRGDQTIQYVMFARRAGQVATHMGGDDKETILRQITAIGLRHLFGA